ncbi:MAG TPA: hypothetical protein VGB38_08225 [bacterium]
MGAYAKRVLKSGAVWKILLAILAFLILLLVVLNLLRKTHLPETEKENE